MCCGDEEEEEEAAATHSHSTDMHIRDKAEIEDIEREALWMRMLSSLFPRSMHEAL